MNSKILTFKQELNRVFDDNLHTKQWHNFVDYTIVLLFCPPSKYSFLPTTVL